MLSFTIRTAMIAAFGSVVAGELPLLRNGSFEDDGTSLNGVGYVSQGNVITAWDAERNGECARNTAGMAFHDNGAMPDGKVVAVIQNRSALRQAVGPFVEGQVYRLHLRANGRAADAATLGRCGTLEVRLNQTLLIGPLEVTAVDDANEFGAPFHVLEAIFQAGDGVYPLEISQIAPLDGISVLIDDVRIEAVDLPEARAVVINRARSRATIKPTPGLDLRAARWIWAAEETEPAQAAPAGSRYLRRTFDLPSIDGLQRAYLLGAADNRAEVSINGVYGGTLESFSQWSEIDMTAFLRPGRNVISVEAINMGDTPNPAGFVAAVVVQGNDAVPLASFVTDAQWRTSRVVAPGWQTTTFDDTAWEPAHIVGSIGCQPWGNFGLLTWLVPDDFVEFKVPGYEKQMELLRQLFWLHYPPSGPLATLWDGWMSMSSLWPDSGTETDMEGRRTRWRQALEGRRIDREGYVSTHQHHGFGHGEGWPFPTWSQAGGVGWQFATEGLPYRMRAPASVAAWGLEGLQSVSRDSTAGWTLKVTADTATLTTPSFDVDSLVSPFVRFEWTPDFPNGTTATLQWCRPGETLSPSSPSADLPLVPDGPGGAFTHVPLYRLPSYGGRLGGLRVTFNGGTGGTFCLRGLCTAVDTRHTINNPCYLQGCTEYFNWTGDMAFLRANIDRMRRTLDYAIREFRLVEYGCVFAPWVGHDGVSGITRTPAGTEVHEGLGVGANYWDLLPFGGKDALATITMVDALRRMAALETAIAGHPDWGIPDPAQDRTSDQLQALAKTMTVRFQDIFWNPVTGRFAASVDAEGVAHDYGYTFVNNEALTFGMANAAQATSIMEWLSGRRTVAGDTSTGADIYHFRFGPRASTRRNIDWYTFAWSRPEGIAWGGQVQDGGAVLGFAYHDMMAKLLTSGPDAAWAVLHRTLDWFADVRAEGGYRAYYAKPGRGTLQGGGPPGGLGMDCEFYESVLVPQIMLYGFLGIRALPDGLALDPRLPSDWPALEVTRIRFRTVTLDVRAEADTVVLEGVHGLALRTLLYVPDGWRIEGATPLGPPAMGGQRAFPVELAAGRRLVLTRTAVDKP